MRHVLKLFLAFILVFGAFDSYADHFLGGEVSYEFVRSKANGVKRYRISFKIYKDCSPSAAAFDSFFVAGIYNNDATRTINSTLLFKLGSIVNVDPLQGGTTCAFTPNICIQQALYVEEIDLPSSLNGYHIFYQRCCRNSSIKNLLVPNNQGFTYYAFIPPTRIINSTPTFLLSPLPFICANDTTMVLNSVYDKDGDSIVYNMVTPFAGGSKTNPQPPAGLINMPFPFPFVNYASGFSSVNPFGAGGYAAIDETGLTKYYAPLIGNYALAIEIKEYRNGELISISYRDLQMLVFGCTPNPTPKLAATTTIITVTEGDSLNLPITFTDPTDSIFITGYGPMINQLGQIPVPRPVFTPAAGFRSATANMTWKIDCKHRRPDPYWFTIRARDNGCPNKNIYYNYFIYVKRSTTGTDILGKKSLCLNDSATYTIANSSPNSTYLWSIVGGGPVPYSNVFGSPTYRVKWSIADTAKIQVIEISNKGCRDTLRTSIVVGKPGIADAGPVLITICSNDTVTIGTVNDSTMNYTWSPTSGLINANVGIPQLILPNFGTTILNYKYNLVATQKLSGCSAMDTISIRVAPKPPVNAGLDKIICSDDSVVIGQTPRPNLIYQWYPSNNLSSDTISNPVYFKINTSGALQTYSYVLRAINPSTLCYLNDTVLINIKPRPKIDAGPDKTICWNDTLNIGILGESNQTYLWSPKYGLIDSTTFALNRFYIKNQSDTLNKYQYFLKVILDGCVFRDTLNIGVRGKPANSIINGNVNPCLNTQNLTYSIGNFNPTSAYLWSVKNGNLIGLNNGNSIKVNWNTQSLGYVKLNQKDVYGCSPLGDSLKISISNPKIDSIIGPFSVCPNVSMVRYRVNQSGGQDFYWTIEGGSIVSGNGGSSILVNWFGSNSNASLKVYSKSQYDCFSDTVTAGIVISTLLNTPAPIGLKTVCQWTSNVVYSTSQTPGSTYIWTILGGQILSGNGTSSVSVVWDTVGTGTITVQEFSGLGCGSLPTSTYVNVLPKPTANFIVGPQVFCFVTDSSSYNIQGFGGSKYKWVVSNGVSFVTVSDSAIRLLWPSAGNYIIKGVETSASGCVGDTIPLIINVLPLPSVNAGIDKTICSRDSVLIGSPSVLFRQYSWDPSFGLSATNTSFTKFSKINYGIKVDTISIILTVKDVTNTCLNKDTAVVFVKPQPIVNAGLDSTFCSSDTIRIGEQAQNQVKYSWMPLLGLSDTSISNPTFNLRNYTDTVYTQNYIVKATSIIFGCFSFDTLNLNAKPLPVFSVGLPKNICAPDTVQIGTLGQTKYAYQWSPSTNLSDQNLSNPFFNIPNLLQVAASYKYNLTVTYPLYNCSLSDTVSVLVRPRPIFQNAADVVFCSGDTVKIGQNNKPEFSYQWILGANLSSNVISNPNLSLVNPTNQHIIYPYILKVKFDQYNCVDFDTLNVRVNPLPKASPILGLDSVCELSGPHNYFAKSTLKSSYLWTSIGGSMVSGQSTSSLVMNWNGFGVGKLTYVETDSNTCVGPKVDKSISIFRLPSKPLPIKGLRAICQGDFDNKTYEIQALPNLKYTWVVTNGDIISGQNTSKIVVNWLSLPGTVKVNAYNIINCESEPREIDARIDDPKIKLNCVTIDTLKSKNIIFKWTLIDTVEFNGHSLIYVKKANETVWKLNNSVDSKAGKGEIGNLEVDKYAYDIKMLIRNTCFDSIWSDVHRTVLLIQPNTFEDNIYLNWTKYEGWNGNATYSIIKETFPHKQETVIDLAVNSLAYVDEIKETDLGSYYRIKASDLSSPEISLSNKVLMKIPATLYFPTAFTPNNNGINDVFKPIGTHIASFNMKIWDKWGEQIFETNDINVGWNGYKKNILVNQGIYMVKASYVDAFGQVKEYLGKVLVLN